MCLILLKFLKRSFRSFQRVTIRLASRRAVMGIYNSHKWILVCHSLTKVMKQNIIITWSGEKKTIKWSHDEMLYLNRVKGQTVTIFLLRNPGVYTRSVNITIILISIPWKCTDAVHSLSCIIEGLNSFRNHYLSFVVYFSLPLSVWHN